MSKPAKESSTASFHVAHGLVVSVVVVLTDVSSPSKAVRVLGLCLSETVFGQVPETWYGMVRLLKFTVIGGWVLVIFDIFRLLYQISQEEATGEPFRVLAAWTSSLLEFCRQFCGMFTPFFVSR